MFSISSPRLNFLLTIMNTLFKNKKIILGGAVFFAALGLALAYVSTPSGALEVHFFDVGQGDAIFIETPNGRQVLIDGGRDARVIEKLGRVMPFYDRSIDLVVATHMDSDHIGGLLMVLRQFEVGGILVSTTESNTELSEAFWGIIKEKDIAVMQVERGDNFLLDDGVNMLVLAPWPELLNGAKDNDTSVVVKLTYKNDSFLFTGDLEKRGEYALVQSGIDVTADVLKLGHHGSKTSSVPLFLARVAPRLVLIQVGKNSYGHPHPSVLERLRGVNVLRNDIRGDITLYSYGDSF